jgi:predicted permease
MGIGFSSKRFGVLKSGDERVFSAYLYYFALPALFIVNMSEQSFTLETVEFMLAGVAPIFIVIGFFVLLYLALRFSVDTLYLLILSTIFGSLAFFGIPFITFAFPGEGEKVATLAVASISIISVAVSITILELFSLKQSGFLQSLKTVIKRLSRNPLIISILIGISLSLLNLTIPSGVSQPLHMLGSTTSAVAIFMLGAFLHGRTYSKIHVALGLSMLRIVLLPVIAYSITTFLALPALESSTLVLMHAMPVAVSTIVLSERYNFFKDTIASLLLVSSLGAGLYLNLWLLVLGG